MILFQRQQRATQQCWACCVQKTHLNVQTALGQVQTQVLRRKHREAWSHLFQPIKPPGCSHREPPGGTSSFHAVCFVFRHRTPNKPCLSWTLASCQFLCVSQRGLGQCHIMSSHLPVPIPLVCLFERISASSWSFFLNSFFNPVRNSNWKTQSMLCSLCLPSLGPEACM